MTEPCFQAERFIAEKQRGTILTIGYTNTGRVSFQVHPAAIKYLLLFALCQIRADTRRLFSTEMVNSQRPLRAPARESIRTIFPNTLHTSRETLSETLTLTRDSAISIILIKLVTQSIYTFVTIYALDTGHFRKYDNRLNRFASKRITRTTRGTKIFHWQI